MAGSDALTLLDVIQAVSEVAANDQETLATVSISSAVVRCGSLRWRTSSRAVLICT